MNKLTPLLLFIIFIFPIGVQAELMTFEEKYTYDASEADSKLTCRAISLLEVKRLLLEKIGTYVEASSEVNNYELTKDEIISITAGIVRTEIIEESWNGKTYSLIAMIEVDPESVAEAIYELRKDRSYNTKFKKLESMNEMSLFKIEELKKELSVLQNNLIHINRDYDRAYKIADALDLFETGLESMRSKKYNKAISAFSKAIKITPKYNYYFYRGRAYMKTYEYKKALADFNRTLELKPNAENVYFFRGKALRLTGKKEKGLRDIKKAAKLGHGNAKKWLKLHKTL